MSTTGTRLQSKDDLTIRYFPFSQDTANPETTSQSNPYGNIIRIRFPINQSFKNAEVSLVNLEIYYSWRNITAAFGNNTFSYSFPTAAGYQTFNVTIPDGFYSLDDLSAIFQQIQFTNGTYLINSSGNPVYFLYWVSNTTFYRTTLFSNAVPANGVGYTVPANYPGGGPPTTAQDPILIINATNAPANSATPGLYSFSKTMGYLPGSYPTLTVAETGVSQSYNGQYPPVIESTSCVQVACNIANSSAFSLGASNVIYLFSPNLPYGEQLQINPHFPRWVPITDGFYPYIDLYFLDSNGLLLNMQDPHVSGSIQVRGM
jgi:hypothetical protein